MGLTITCVCADVECAHHERNPIVEINFLDGKIYWVCPECNKTNIIETEKQPPKLPRIRSMG